jgi:hypothetical protein
MCIYVFLYEEVLSDLNARRPHENVYHSFDLECSEKSEIVHFRENSYLARR